MTERIEQIALIGGGQASAVAARTLRRKGYDGRIVVLGQEAERPYQRPPLSKEYLAGQSAEDCALHLLPESWTEAHSVEVRTGVTAMKISAADGGVLLDDGTTLAADRVLIATGGRARQLPETCGDRILQLRTRADADLLRTHLVPGARLVVIGAGFIGAEVASTARTLGVDVVVLEAAPVPLARVLGDELGAACARLHHAAGVDLRTGVLVEAVTQHGVEVRLQTNCGTFVADCVLVGIGMLPNDQIAIDSGLAVGDGIQVDEYCRTSQQHVYAAGDVANQWHPGYGERLRVEHYDNASTQGSVAAQHMLGFERAAAEPHWFWSDQYGANLQHVGRALPGDRLVVRGDLAAPGWSAFHVADGLVHAAFAMNRPEDVMVARELIGMGLPIPIEVLGDDSVDLSEALEDL